MAYDSFPFFPYFWFKLFFGIFLSKFFFVVSFYFFNNFLTLSRKLHLFRGFSMSVFDQLPILIEEFKPGELNEMKKKVYTLFDEASKLHSDFSKVSDSLILWLLINYFCRWIRLPNLRGLKYFKITRHLNTL